ncbi:YopX family protein [Enterococcus mundtii]|uniref:YopX family protein n=1 Tax=Enterococcus mundtii TaxID=53346 RepID=UPI0010BEFFB3|nr:YopX family protein [Enterococcus mundtii]QCJ56122.1 DNA-packaging protein [Enterococcus mundtii]
MIPKFRVWDKNNKCMHEVRSIWIGDDFPLNSHVVYSLGNTVEVIFDDIELMQSTGLKDKNGVDVYQGDIIKCTSGCPHEVIWLEEYGGTFIGGMPAWYLSGLNNGYSWAGREEVIGNIYENSELLEEVKK